METVRIVNALIRIPGDNGEPSAFSLNTLTATSKNG